MGEGRRERGGRRGRGDGSRDGGGVFPFVEFVAAAEEGGGGHGEDGAFGDAVGGAVVGAEFGDGHFHDTGGGSHDKDVVAHAEVGGLDFELGHAQLGEIVGHFAEERLAFRGLGAVDLAPLAETAAEVVAVPEAAVEDGGEPFAPMGDFFRPVGAVEAGVEGLVVALADCFHVFRGAGAAFDFEHPHPGVNHLVEESDGAEVFGRHDVLAVHFQLELVVGVLHEVRTAAYLVTRAPVRRGVHLVEAEVAFPGDGHAEGAVGEHFDAEQFAAGAPDVVGDDLPMDFGHLPHVEFPG